ncbi:hypothetical protein F511_18704 [Dorcoceras hygrometricum]|uniref:Uncharacterized protein n=1 Tax=Dorcoceras hygrometricum TaxID=472368 RepID=A0A2Z7BWE0_9LAMI|nr:hypothetical protein F511_18704 [Dorcoceras hygrometricum]
MIPLGITDSASKNQLVVVSVQYGPFNPYIPIRSTTIGKSRVARDPIAMHTSWRSNSDIASVTSIGYPRMSASGESSTTMHRLLHASGSHPIPTPYDPKTNQYNQDLGLIHTTNGNHLESPKEGSSIDHQVTIYLHAQNITMFPTNETWIFELKEPHCMLTMNDWFLQTLSVIPRGAWDDVVRRLTMVQWPPPLSLAVSGRRLPPPPLLPLAVPPCHVQFIELRPPNPIHDRNLNPSLVCTRKPMKVLRTESPRRDGRNNFRRQRRQAVTVAAQRRRREVRRRKNITRGEKGILNPEYQF